MAKRISRAGAYLAYMIAVAGMIGISVLSGIFVGVHAYVFIATYYLLCMALPCALIIRRADAGETLRPDPPRISFLLPVILLAGLAVGVVNGVTIFWEVPFELAGMKLPSGGVIEAANAKELVLSVLINAALPAVCEEVLFRGVLLTALEPYGTKRAAVLSSALFVLLHGSIIGAPAEFLVGIALCLITITTKSIYSGIIFHTTYNALILVLNYVLGSGDEGQTVLESLGGASGLISVVIDIALFALPAYYFIRALLYRAKAEHVVIYPARRVKAPVGARLLLIAALVFAAVLYVPDLAVMLA